MGSTIAIGQRQPEKLLWLVELSRRHYTFFELICWMGRSAICGRGCTLTLTDVATPIDCYSVAGGKRLNVDIFRNSLINSTKVFC